MKAKTIKRLQQINKEFYDQRVTDFSCSRRAAWQGWEKVWSIICSKLPPKPKILDLGCGNARFGGFMRQKMGGQFEYIGVDESLKLLGEAKLRLNGINHQLIQSRIEVYGGKPGEVVGLFGVIHHIPGEKNRSELIGQLSKMVKPGGFLIISFWRVEKQTNLIQRRAEAAEIIALGIDPSDLEPHDYLLPFGEKEGSWRYVHGFGMPEIDKLKDISSCKLMATFTADGKTGEINRYLVWQKLPPQ